MSGAPSRLLAHLEARIAACKVPLEADTLVAERACYRARQGHLDEALQTAARLRQRHDARPQAVVTAWVNLIEGLCSHFDDLGVAARDKLARAHALSALRPASRLHLLCAAWLAHVDYTHHHPAAMSQHVREALSLAPADDHSVRARACMVVAQALHLGSGLERANPWYAASHRHAVNEGDDLTISALIHNRGWLELTRLGEGALNHDGSVEVKAAFAGITSSQSYDKLIGAASIPTITPLLQAQIECSRGECAAALALFEAHRLAAEDGKGHSRLASTMLADQAWCRAQLGQSDAALADAIAAQASLVAGTHVDDRAATHSRLYQVHHALGDDLEASRHAVLASTHWQAFRQVQADMVTALEGLDPTTA